MFFLANKKIPTSRNYINADNLSFNQIPLNKHQRTFLWTTPHLLDYFTIYFSIFLSSLAYGVAMVAIALKLESNVNNDLLITLSTVFQITAGVLFSNYLPKFVSKLGIVNSIFYGSIIAGVSTLGLFNYINYFVWAINIFIMGMSLFITSVTRNTVMIDASPEKLRAFSISLGSCLVAIGNSLGPIIVNYVGSGQTLTTFLIASLIHISSGLIILRLKKINSSLRHQKKIMPWRYVINSPKIMFSGFSFSFAMSSCSAFAIIYGLRVGMSQEQATLLLSCLLIGTITYIPFSYLCNIFNLRFLMILFSMVSLFLIYKIYSIEDVSRLHLYFFLLFSCLAGMKLPTIVLINEKYKSTQRLAVNSAFSQFTLLGAVCGLITSGILINIFEYRGLWLSISGILVLFLIFCSLNYLYRMINKTFVLKDFSILKKTIEPVELE